MLLTLRVKYGETEKTFTTNDKAFASQLVRVVKKKFGIDSGIGCQLKLNNVALKSTAALGEQKVKDGSLLALESSGKMHKKKLTLDDAITFGVHYEGEFKSFTAPKLSTINSVLNYRIKPAFDVQKELNFHLEMNGTNLKVNESIEAAGVADGANLTLCLNEKQPKKKSLRESKQVTLCGMNLTVFVNVRECLVKNSNSAGLYAILDKVSKAEQQKHERPLKLVRYVGIVTTTTIEKRFEEHCSPKSANSRRTPGTGSTTYNSAVLSKLNENDLGILVSCLLDAIRGNN